MSINLIIIITNVSRDVLLTPSFAHVCEEMAEKDVKVSNDIFSVRCQSDSIKKLTNFTSFIPNFATSELLLSSAEESSGSSAYQLHTAKGFSFSNGQYIWFNMYRNNARFKMCL